MYCRENTVIAWRALHHRLGMNFAMQGTETIVKRGQQERDSTHHKALS